MHDDDDVTRIMPVPRVLERQSRKRAHGLATAPLMPVAGMKDVGETFLGDTHFPGRAAEDQGTSPNQLRSSAKRGARLKACSVSLPIAAGAGLGLTVALWSCLQPTPARMRDATPAGGPALSSEPRPSVAEPSTAVARIPSSAPVSAVPDTAVGARVPHLIQVFRFEITQQESEWVARAHEATVHGDCMAALEYYQRLVNLSGSASGASSRWAPYLEQVRQRCSSDAADQALVDQPGAGR